MYRSIFTYFLALGFILVTTTPLAAQNNGDNERWEEYDLEYRTFRVALVPGLSTNGIDATKYTAKYSFNILGGYNGALDGGFELGGLFNANKYYMNGVQIAGLANYSGEDASGIQLAGITNYSGEDMQGIQLSGAANISVEDMQGIQLSGLLNVAGESSQGIQGAGIINGARYDMQGLYGAGIGNIAGGEAQGLFFSGIFNIAKDQMQGIAASGIVNYAEEFQGIAVAPINASRFFQGIQLGQVNVAEEFQGIQVGFLNYAKEFEGVPVGLISYYGNGRSNIDVWASDGGFTNFGLKLGTNEIYNMLSVGYNTLLDRDVWQLGWSIGRHNQYENHFLYSDFSYFKINEGGWTKDLNSNFKYRLLFGKELSDNFKIYGGPTLNMLVSKVDNSSDYTWYRLFDYGAKGREYIFWAGLSMGIELF